MIENLGATLDQFDAIDFSDNEIRKLDGFPLLRRLKTLLVNNNRICLSDKAIHAAAPSADAASDSSSTRCKQTCSVSTPSFLAFYPLAVRSRDVMAGALAATLGYEDQATCSQAGSSPGSW